MLVPEKPLDEDERLAMVRYLGADVMARDEVLDRLLDVARRQSGAPTAYVSMLEENHQRFIARSGLDLEETDRSLALCGHAILQPDQVLWIPDARLDERFADNPFVRGSQKIIFYAGAPVVVNSRAVGSLCIVGPEPRARDEVLAGLLQDLSVIAAERLIGLHKRMSLERALEATSDAFLVADENDRYISWSAGAERLFGYTAAEAFGRSGELLGLDCKAVYAAAQSEAPARGEKSRGVRAEAVATRKDGSKIDVEVCLAEWHEDGLKRTSATIRDISERKAQKAELVRSKAQAEAANLAKSVFLTNMSHELRTPLNGVIGVVELLASTPMSDHQRELTGIIQSSANQLQSLIGDILDLARIESGEVEIARETFDLALEVERAGQLCALRASEKGLGLFLHQAASPVWVVGDPLRLRQVVINLLNNAIKFTDTGAVTMRVVRSGPDLFRFEVQDTGIGFSQAQREALFERFQQADGTITRKFGGTGLGLAISRELVEAMGGRIDCRSTQGEGATFWFELPLPCGECEATGTSPAMSAPAPTPAALGRVLVADDNGTNRRVAELILAAAGVETVSVEDGVQALEAFGCARFDAVLMDMMMPRMDGLKATRAIREREAAEGMARTPIIMLTANSLQEHVAQALSAGADLHLPKPVNAAALYQALAAVSQRQAGLDARSNP